MFPRKWHLRKNINSFYPFFSSRTLLKFHFKLNTSTYKIISGYVDSLSCYQLLTQYRAATHTHVPFLLSCETNIYVLDHYARIYVSKKCDEHKGMIIIILCVGFSWEYVCVPTKQHYFVLLHIVSTWDLRNGIDASIAFFSGLALGPVASHSCG